MSSGILELSLTQLSIAYIFILFLLWIFRKRKIPREKQIFIASLRMTLQLTAMGYVLMLVFENPSWWLTGLMILIMMLFSIHNAIARVKGSISPELRRIVALSMFGGALSTSAFFVIVVLQAVPWFHPQYFIPVSGMIVGNCMTGVALGANKLCSDMEEKRVMLENSLMLGATPAQAAREIINDAFDSAILPTMNNMLTMGIVNLPGMMTGQILAGVFPLTAIKYQIAVMLAILGGTALTTILFVLLGYKTFFTRDCRLK